MTLDDVRFLCYGPFCYGIGHTPDEAYELARKDFPTRRLCGGRLLEYQMLIVHKDTSVDDMGRVSFPRKHPPRSLYVRGKTQAKFINAPTAGSAETRKKRAKATA